MKMLEWCPVYSDQKSLAFGKYYNAILDFYINGARVKQTFVDVEILYHESESSIQIIITDRESPYTLRENPPFPIAIFMRNPIDCVFYRFDAILPFNNELLSYSLCNNHILLY